jgi:hypothetical protein
MKKPASKKPMPKKPEPKKPMPVVKKAKGGSVDGIAKRGRTHCKTV